MQPLARFLALLLLLLAVVALRADDSLDHVRRAQALLGNDVWSQIIRIENRAEESRYPKKLHALVFELAGILWFYTPTDGTQSFSLHLGNLDAEKADFGPLLRDIEPGFEKWRRVSPKTAAVLRADVPLENGCFIESVAELRGRLARGAELKRPQLLSYHLLVQGKHTGHTVLAYETEAGTEIFDPVEPARRFVFARELGADPVALARAHENTTVLKARYVSLGLGDSSGLSLTRAQSLPSETVEAATIVVAPPERSVRRVFARERGPRV